MIIFVQWRLLPYKDSGLCSPLSAKKVTNDEGLIFDGMNLLFSLFFILFLLSKFQFCLPDHTMAKSVQLSHKIFRSCFSFLA